MTYAADPVKRAAILAAARKRLDWLEANPRIPVMEWGEEMLYPGTEAEVAAVAALSGQPREAIAAGCRVIVRFGAGVAYVAVGAKQEAVAA